MNYKYRLYLKRQTADQIYALKQLLVDNIAWMSENRWNIWHEDYNDWKYSNYRQRCTIIGFTNEKDAFYARLLLPNVIKFEYAAWLD